jgi:hypothetical protein
MVGLSGMICNSFIARAKNADPGMADVFEFIAS